MSEPDELEPDGDDELEEDEELDELEDEDEELCDHGIPFSEDCEDCDEEEDDGAFTSSSREPGS